MNVVRCRKAVVLGALSVLAGVLAACGSPSAKSSSTSTLPPLPPDVIAYVTLVGSGAQVGLGQSVAPIDLTASLKGTPISDGSATYPDVIAIDHSAGIAYVANYATNTVTPIDLSTGRPEKAIAAGPGPAGIAIAPNDKTAYVTDAGTAPIGDTVTPIDLKTKRPLHPITVGDGPQGIAITPNGEMAYVANAGAIVSGQSGSVGDTVTPIDLKTGRVLVPIRVGNAPIVVAISPDGQSVFVANDYSGSVSPIDVASNTAGTPIEVDGAPQSIAFTLNGQDALVADSSSAVSNVNDVAEIDVSTNSVSTTVPLPKGPSAVAVAPGGATAYVVCFGANAIVPLVLGTKLQIGATIALGGGPFAIALTTAPQGTFGEAAHRSSKHSVKGH